MARRVLFHEKIVVHPGAEAFVDVSGMVQPNVDIEQVAGIIAEAPNGQPGVLHVFADDKSARDFFGAGSDAADAVKFLTDTSPDDAVEQGAALVYVYVPNVSKRAEYWLVANPLRDIAGAVNAGVLEITVTGAAKKVGSVNAYVEVATPAGAIDDQLQNMIIEVSSGWGKGQQRQVKIVREFPAAGSGTWRLSLRDDQDWLVAPYLAGAVVTKIQIKIPVIQLQSSEWGPRGLQNEATFKPVSGDPDAGYRTDTKYDGRTEVLSEPIGGTLTPKMLLKLDPTDADLTAITGWLRPGSAEFTTAVGASATVLDTAIGLTPAAEVNRYVVITGISALPAQADLLGKMYKISANTAITVTLTGTGLGVVPGAGLKYRVVHITDAYFQVTGEDGDAKALAIYFDDSADGTFNGGSGVALLASIDLGQYATMQALRDKLNEVPGVYAVLGDAVPNSLETLRFDFGEGADHWQAGIIQGPTALDSGTVIRDNVESMVEWVNGTLGRLAATRAIGPGNNDSVKGYNDEIGGFEPDDMGGVLKKFYDGEVGVSSVKKADSTDTNIDATQRISYEHGLELLEEIDEIRTEVICASEDMPGWSTGDIDVLILDFQEHLLDAEEQRMYRNGYMGLKLPLESGTYNGTTYDRGILDWIRVVDDERMSLSAQEVQAFDSDSVEQFLPAWAFACKTASIQLGTELGEGLTNKHIDATDFRQPIGDWRPRDKVQGRKAVLGALLYLKKVRGTYRIARGSTAKVSSNNLARTDINVWEIRNHVIRQLSIKLEDRFGGRGIGNPGEGVRFVAPASSASVREAVGTELDEMRADGIIVDSENAQGTRIKAYQGLRVVISGDIVRVKVQVFPKTAVNFILIDFAFQLPVQSAA